MEAKTVEALKAVLSQVPSIKLKDLESESQGSDGQVNIVGRVSIGGKRHTLACEVKADGQPRYVRLARLPLRNYVARLARAMQRPCSSLPFYHRKHKLSVGSRA